MNVSNRAAEDLMSAFAARTGILMSEASSARYLWTDAFAVCNFLALHQLTKEDKYRTWAMRLVGEVHHVLGRHRADGARTGWISGMSESEGELHPTCGGLRIGKRLGERGVNEPFDEQLEWDRDGQYFHYLTKWMHALHRVAFATGDVVYNAWALELAQVAHRAFVYSTPRGGKRRMYWKMSIDLSRPLVTSMGQPDPLDGFVTFNRLQVARGKELRHSGSFLDRAIAEMLQMCAGTNFGTGDELGIGGLLVDANHLVQMVANGEIQYLAIIDDVLAGADDSLRFFARNNRLDQPAEVRLAFRELGLSIGLRAVRGMRDSVQRHSQKFSDSDRLSARLDSIARFGPLIDLIEQFWLRPASQNSATWVDHRDINAVMLATSLAPHVFLMNDP